jgi:hypothetical protein
MIVRRKRVRRRKRVQQAAEPIVMSKQIKATTAAPATTAGVASLSSPDKARSDELSSRVTSYQAIVPTDDQHRRDIADVVAKANDEIKRLSGSPRGLQQPR